MTTADSRERPDVSVVMIAYDVEEYIAHALESVLMQEGDFTYEILVGEDCSTDRTREIVLRYAREHPDKVRPLLRERNLGMNPNFAATYLECTGRYVALLDADDFWISRRKLQKQIEFLEAHPDCTICFHNAAVIYDDGSTAQHPFHMRRPRHRISAGVPKPISTLEDIAPGNFMQTCSVMYRGGTVRELPEWYLSVPTFDWPLHVLHAEHGDIGYIDEVLGTYRVHPGGFWSAAMSMYDQIDDIEHMIRAYGTLKRYLPRRYGRAMRKALPYHFCEAATVSLKAGHPRKARRFALRALRASGPRVGPEQKRAIRLIRASLGTRSAGHSGG